MKPVPKSLEVLVSTSEQKISVTQTRQDGPDRNDAAEAGVARDLLMVVVVVDAIDARLICPLHALQVNRFFENCGWNEKTEALPEVRTTAGRALECFFSTYQAPTRLGVVKFPQKGTT